METRVVSAAYIFAELRTLHQRTKTRFTLVSPWVQDLRPFGFELREGIEYQVLVRGGISDIATGTSELPFLRELVRRGARVAALSTLHAKIYLADEVAALVGSANFTRRGLLGWSGGNDEVALWTEDSGVLTALTGLVERWFERAETVDEDWLDRRAQEATECHQLPYSGGIGWDDGKRPPDGPPDLAERLRAVFDSADECRLGLRFLRDVICVAREEGFDVETFMTITRPVSQPLIRINLGKPYFASLRRHTEGLRYHLTLLRDAVHPAIRARVVAPEDPFQNTAYAGFWFAGPIDFEMVAALEPALRRAVRWARDRVTGSHNRTWHDEGLDRLIGGYEAYSEWLERVFAVPRSGG